MNSGLFYGSTKHSRLLPKKHSFSYKTFYLWLDLFSIELFESNNLLFSYNSFNLFSIWDQDYLYKSDDKLIDKVFNCVEKKQLNFSDINSIMLLTMPRYLNYCFNPVSFFYCFSKDKTCLGILTYVVNTFKEGHIYWIESPFSQNRSLSELRIDKSFYVSPFLTLKGRYSFNFKPVKDDLFVGINYFESESLVLETYLKGKFTKLTQLSFFKLFFAIPLSIFLTIPRIHWQALKLFLFKRIKFMKKNHPISQDTIRYTKPSFIQKTCSNILQAIFSRFQYGYLKIQTHYGDCFTFGDKNATHSATIHVKNPRFFSQLIFSGEVGLGESFVKGYWESDNLSMALTIIAKNYSFISQNELNGHFIFNFYNRMKHFFNRNTISNSKHNIHKHYDLNSNFFNLFLGESMMYSSALYSNRSTTLTDAQFNKIHTIVSNAKISKEHHVLEIGSGWGTLAIYLATEIGCKVTTITISQSQHDYVLSRISSLGLEDKINLLLLDYRHLSGTFDRIISIEMLEAVGHKFLPTFFSKCNELLTTGGIMSLQTITMPDHLYNTYRKSSDWIQKHIFPGGHLPSLGIINTIIEKNTSLLIDKTTDIGLNYAQTLNDWYLKFKENLHHVKTMGFDETFIKLWTYYLNYCEAGFKSRHISNHQLVFRKE